MSDRRTPRIAANPIPYSNRGGRMDKSQAVFDLAFTDFAAIGIKAVKADVPEGMTAAEYRAWIDGYGLEPSLSLFNSPFDETVDIADEVERAKRFAADQIALGLDRTMVSSVFVAARMEQPAVGADFNPDRLALAVEEGRDRLAETGVGDEMRRAGQYRLIAPRQFVLALGAGLDRGQPVGDRPFDRLKIA